MDIIIPSGTDLAIYISQEDLCNIEKTQGFKSILWFPSALIAGWKIHHGFENRGMFHLLCQFTGGYLQFLESSRKFAILTQHSKEFWCIGLCTCCGSSSSFLYWGTFTRIWWWNCGATGAVMGFIQIGFSWESPWSLAKFPRAFESWVLVSVLLQETIRPVWVRTASFNIAVVFNMW